MKKLLLIPACGVFLLLVLAMACCRMHGSGECVCGRKAAGNADAQGDDEVMYYPDVAEPEPEEEAVDLVAQDEDEDEEDEINEDEPERREPKFSRPEDLGEDFSKLPQSDLLKRLAETEDRIELRKAAKSLGDRSIAGTLTLSKQESAILTNAVQKCLQRVKATDSNDREEGRQQIHRFWWSAAPTLLENIDSEDGAIAETAIKSLILMRNETILKSLMNTAKTAPALGSRLNAIFTLGCMTEQRESLIDGRTCMDRESSKKLADTLMRPFLDELAKTETNAEVRNAVFSALEDLTLAAERRLVPEKQK